MDEKELMRLQEKVRPLIPPKAMRKLHARLKVNPTYKEFYTIIMHWVNTYFQKYEERYYNIAKVISLGVDPPLLEPDAFEEYENEFVKAAEHNLEEFNRITFHYFQKVDSKFPIVKLLISLLILAVPIQEFAEESQDISYPEFRKQVLESFLINLIDQDQERFEIYFFDWNLKFGYLIEGYFKEMLCMRLMIKNLLEEQDNTDLYERTPFIGQILDRLGVDMEQRKYRNAIFHSDFFLEYKVNYNERLVTFKHKDGTSDSLSAKEFVSSFFKTFQLIFTFYFTLEYVHFIKIRKGNEEVRRYIKQSSNNSLSYLNSIFNFDEELDRG